MAKKAKAKSTAKKSDRKQKLREAHGLLDADEKLMFAYSVIKNAFNKKETSPDGKKCYTYTQKAIAQHFGDEVIRHEMGDDLFQGELDELMDNE